MRFKGPTRSFFGTKNGNFIWTAASFLGATARTERSLNDVFLLVHCLKVFTEVVPSNRLITVTVLES